MTTERIKCSRCCNQILPETAARNNGLCGVCKRKFGKEAAKAALAADIRVIRYTDEFQKLRAMTRDTVRRAFEDLMQQCANEQIYGICIYAYHSVGPPVFCASTLSGFAEREAKLRAKAAQPNMLSHIPKQELIYSTGKWSPYEWEYEAYRWEEFRPILDYLESLTPKTIDKPGMELHAMVLAAYVASLHDLDKAGLFTAYRQSSSLVLFCSDCESSDREWYENASAKFLNPPKLYQIFFNEAAVYDQAEEVRQRELLGDECQQRFNMYLELL